MTREVFDQLQQVRRFRVKSAERDVAQARQAVNQAIGEVESRKRELETYLLFRKGEEDRLYESLEAKTTSVNGLDTYRKQLALLAEREMAQERAVDEAKKYVVKAEAELESRRELLNQAVRNEQKLVEVIQSFADEERVEHERAADLELEDFVPKGNADW